MTEAELIGRAGDQLEPSDTSITLHRAGGPVCVWPEVPEEALRKHAKCKMCQGTRALVHQVHAPLPGSVKDRVLMLFVCVNASCCTAAGAFTAVRCQLQTQSEPERPPSAPQAHAAHSFGDVTWGESATAPDSKTGSSTTGAQAGAQPGAANDFSDLLSQMDELAVQPTAAPDASHVPASSSRASAPASAICLRRDGRLHSLGPELPGFEIDFEPARTKHPSALDDKHIQRLLEEYQKRAGNETESEYDTESCGGSTIGEAYEETDAMTQFVEDLAQSRYQCSRYGRWLRALWPGEGGLPDAAACASCGAQRTAELQVLSPMWHFMEETASWYSYFRPAPKALDTSIFQQKDWDWASVVVLTCPNSCHVGEESWCLAEEEVAAFNIAHSSGSDGGGAGASTSAAKALSGARERLSDAVNVGDAEKDSDGVDCGGNDLEK